LANDFLAFAKNFEAILSDLKIFILLVTRFFKLKLATKSYFPEKRFQDVFILQVVAHFGAISCKQTFAERNLFS